MTYFSPLLVLLVVLNVVSLVLFGIDKFEAINGGWRVSEATLLLVAFLGPFGATGGMLFFRHKTRKAKFLLVPIFMFVQLALLVCLIF